MCECEPCPSVKHRPFRFAVSTCHRAAQGQCRQWRSPASGTLVGPHMGEFRVAKDNRRRMAAASSLSGPENLTNRKR